MPLDYPDWGGQYNDRQFYPLFDQAELAARLGSSITYDRRGCVIWQYDFRYGIGDVGPSTAGAGALVTLHDSMWESPPFSCNIQCGAVVNSSASVERRLPVPQGRRVGFQASVRINSNVDEVRVFLYRYTGSARYYANLVLNVEDDKFQVYVHPGTRIDLLDGLGGRPANLWFCHLKLVCDVEQLKPVRAILDDNEFDLSSYEMTPVSDTTGDHILVRVQNYTTTGVASACLVDNLIVTAAEPE